MKTFTLRNKRTKEPLDIEDVEWWETAFTSKLRELVDEDAPMHEIVKRCRTSATLRFRHMRKKIEEKVPDQD